MRSPTIWEICTLFFSTVAQVFSFAECYLVNKDDEIVAIDMNVRYEPMLSLVCI